MGSREETQMCRCRFSYSIVNEEGDKEMVGRIGQSDWGEERLVKSFIALKMSFKAIEVQLLFT